MLSSGEAAAVRDVLSVCVCVRERERERERERDFGVCKK